MESSLPANGMGCAKITTFKVIRSPQGHNGVAEVGTKCVGFCCRGHRDFSALIGAHSKNQAAHKEQVFTSHHYGE